MNRIARQINDIGQSALTWIVLLVLGSISLLLIWPVLVDGHSLYFRDMQIFFVPMKQFLIHWLEQGVIPYWDPSMFSGTPFLADMQTTIFYPPTLLLLLADGMHGLGLLILFHLLLAAVSAWFYGRYLGLGLAGSYVLALLFSAGGLMVSTFNMINFMQALAWVPLVLWCFERDRRQPDVRNFVWASLTLSLQIYAGAPEVTIMLAMIILLQQGRTEPGLLPRRILRTAIAGVTAILLAAPQLIPTFELFSLSVRTQGLSSDEIASYSMSFQQLTGFWNSPDYNNINWDIFALFADGHVPLFLSLYTGIIPLILAVVALILLPARTWQWPLLAGLGLFLALGSNNPAAMWIFEGIGIFRYPEKYLLLLFFALLMLAANGTDAIEKKLVHKPWYPALMVLLCALVTVDLVMQTRQVTLFGPADYYRLDQLPESQAIRQLGHGRVYSREHYQPQITTVAKLYDSYRRQLSPHIGTLGGLEYINGTGGLVLESHQLVDRMLRGLPPSVTLKQRLAFLNTRYVVSADPAFHYSHSWRRQAQLRSRYLWDIGQPRDFAYFPTILQSETSQSLLGAINDPQFADGTRALIGGDKDYTGLDGKVIRWHRPDPNTIKLDVDVRSRAMLVVSESLYPGWTALMDGEPLAIEPVNQLYMGVWITPGQHQLQFEFRPRGLYAGLMLSSITLILLIFLLIGGGRHRDQLKQHAATGVTS